MSEPEARRVEDFAVPEKHPRPEKPEAAAVAKWIGHRDIAGRIRPQYLALVEAVGLPNVEHYMERFIDWPTDEHRPPPHILERWRKDQLESGEESDERLVRRFRQQIRAYYEFMAWRSVEQMAKTSKKLSQRAEEGELEAAKQVQLQYSGMNLAYTLKEVAAAFGTPKPTPTQIGRMTINMGEPPRRKLRAKTPPSIINAQVREIGSGSDS